MQHKIENRNQHEQGVEECYSPNRIIKCKWYVTGHDQDSDQRNQVADPDLTVKAVIVERTDANVE